MLKTLSAIGLSCLLLSGCGAILDEPPGPCPVATQVNDAARLTRFKEGSGDLSDVLFDVAIENVAYACEYDGEEAVDMVITITMVAAEGPANSEGAANFSYFVAVATTDRQILAREDFAVSAPFEGNLTRVKITETVEPRIPLPPNHTGANYRVFVGLAVTEAELQYNRTRR
ncbi:MAG TPA: hypothetical protein VJL84_05935 [Kiloniellales bacterium]|nr:hypothetical protein [Kiloniellales bacterium]